MGRETKTLLACRALTFDLERIIICWVILLGHVFAQVFVHAEEAGCLGWPVLGKALCLRNVVCFRDVIVRYGHIRVVCLF